MGAVTIPPKASHGPPPQQLQMGAFTIPPKASHNPPPQQLQMGAFTIHSQGKQVMVHHHSSSQWEPLPYTPQGK
ncbi:hypothetical protein M405DRAFT_858299 [Rhizopogon salebrosus TDB-379]|nr:hypothetical protein M405DRAFT_858299 [Rhizopogon salebrosus TDB-379]